MPLQHWQNNDFFYVIVVHHNRFSTHGSKSKPLLFPTGVDRRPSAAAKLPQPHRYEEALFERVEAGDLDGVTALVRDRPNINVNCQNYHGYTPLVVAVRLEDVAMVDFFLQRPGVRLSDAILHAVKTGNKHINEHYGVIRLLLRRGYYIEKPHPPTCFCEEMCQRRRQGEDLSSSLARLNVYRALSSPSYIVQSSPDPILTAFELSQELTENGDIERHFVFEYHELATSCEDFSTQLVDKCRTTDEVQLVLSQREGHTRLKKGDKYPRILLAIEYDIKRLASVLIRMLTLPLIVIMYEIAPESELSRKLRSPVNKFISFVASYFIFLILLYTQNELDTRDPYTLVMLILFTATFVLWVMSYVDIQRNDDVDLPRAEWNQFDLSLISEALFSVAFLFAFVKVMYFFLISHSFGPLLLSLGYMIKDIVKFMVVFIIVVMAFATCLYTLYHHYNGLTRIENGEVIKQQTAFDTLVGNVTRKVDNGHYFTSTIGHLVYVVFHVIGIITLVNMLIAMMSNSYAQVEGGTLPPPFNLIPTPRFFVRAVIRYRKNESILEDDYDSDEEDDKSAERYRRYLNAQKENEAGRTVSIGDLDGISQQLKELKQINKLLLDSAYRQQSLISL
ncbi:hypothetical protein NP493_963g00036 [Ridgeia piscesae]|uniref:Transient receptor ion channel domain-containing protein n=1 Tax=Ridgeia piscesae TaxID=27915 RepID=A0AAD9KL55_RIDPI|nr:hypothetical protein NP493_963g00036 [Ridgeia piscesae]